MSCGFRSSFFPTRSTPSGLPASAASRESLFADTSPSWRRKATTSGIDTAPFFKSFVSPFGRFMKTLRVALTGGRGRVAPFVAAHLCSSQAEVVTFSRRAGDGFQCTSLLTEPGALATFDVVLHLGWSTVPLTSEEMPGVEGITDLPLLQDCSIRVPRSVDRRSSSSLSSGCRLWEHVGRRCGGHALSTCGALRSGKA